MALYFVSVQNLFKNTTQSFFNSLKNNYNYVIAYLIFIFFLFAFISYVIIKILPKTLGNRLRLDI